MRYKKTKFVVILGSALLVIFGLTKTSQATIYYVNAQIGSDSNSGLSWMTAFKSINKATDRYGPLVAGDTILVKPGTYSGFEVTQVGTAQNRITIQKFGTGEVVVDSSVKVSSWTNLSGQIYWASLNAGPTAVVVDRNPLFPEFSLGAVNEGEYHYDSGTKRLYVWAPGGGSPATHEMGIVANDEYSPGVTLRESHNLTIDGLTFRYASGHGIEIYANSVIIENGAIQFNGKAGVSVYAYASATADNVTIQNNDVYHNMLRNWPRGRYKWCCWSMGIVSHGTPNFKAIGNTIHKNGGEGVGSYSCSGGTIIRGNIVYDNWSVNIYVDNQPDAIIENNISYSTTPNLGDLYNNQDDDPLDNRCARRLRPEGIMLGNEDYGSGFNLQNIKVRNNRVANCRRGITYYGEGGGLRNVVIANNSVTVADQPEVGGGWLTGIVVPVASNSNVTVKNNIVYNTNPSNVVMETWSNNQASFNNNLYFSIANANPFRYNDQVKNFSGWKTSLGGNQDSFSLQADPQYLSIDPKSTSFFKLDSNSPAIDAGAVLTDIVSDFAGTLRPQGGAYDIGAYEYVGGVQVDTTPPSSPMSLVVQ